MPKLKNERHEQFCREYLVDLNATRSYLRVYDTKNEDTARKSASKLMTNHDISTRIGELSEKRSKKTQITAEVVLSELYKIATVDIAGAFDENGKLLPIHEIPIEVRKAISAVKVNELYEGNGKEREQIGEVKEIKFWDKNKSLENLGRHLKLFVDRVELSGNDLADRLAKARKKKG